MKKTTLIGVLAVLVALLAVGPASAAVSLPFTETVTPTENTTAIDVTVENATDSNGNLATADIQIKETVNGSTTTVLSETIDSSVDNTATVSYQQIDQNATYEVTVNNSASADAVLVETATTSGSGGGLLSGGSNGLLIVGVLTGIVLLLAMRDNDNMS